MDNIGILKTTYYMNNGIYLTDICEKLVSKSLTFGCTLYKTCNITNSITAGVTFFDL